MHTINLRSCDELVVRASTAVVARITPADWSAPTPCAAWNLADLLAHMTAQHRGFAAAVAGHDTGLEAWQPRPPGDDPIRAYAEAAESVLAAFAAPGALDRDVVLAEMSPQPFPGRVALGFHLIDYVAHGWDVARTIGAAFELPDEVLAVALSLAEEIPDGDFRRVPGAPFAPRLPDPAGSTLDRILALLGRDPRKDVVARG